MCLQDKESENKYKKINKLFIYLFNQYVWITYYVPHTMLGAVNRMISKLESKLLLQWAKLDIGQLTTSEM